MTKRQKYSNGGGPKKVKDVFKLDHLSGNKKQGIKSGVTIETKNARFSADQHNGRNFNTTLDLKLPKTEVTVGRGKGGNFSGKVTRDTSNFLGKNSKLSISVNPKAGFGNNKPQYGITYEKKV